MNLFVLSECESGNARSDFLMRRKLEGVLSRALNVTFLYPSKDRKVGLIHRSTNRLLKSWFTLNQLPKLGKGPNVLLILATAPHFLLSIYALKGWLKQFDLRIGYVMDGFPVSELDQRAMSNLDYLFVMNSEITREIQKVHGVDTHFLPLAIDTSNVGLNQNPRWIDILGYGRTHDQFHKQLIQLAHQPDGPFYFYSTSASSDIEDYHEHMLLQSKLLSHAKLNLCFEASNIPRFQGLSPLLYRWFESWLWGCNPVGRKPFGQGVDELMDWENSVIELPNDQADWLLFLQETLADQETLSANAQRNYRACLLQHDWCYRFQTLFNVVGLPTPESLQVCINALQLKANQLPINQVFQVAGISPITV